MHTLPFKDNNYKNYNLSSTPENKFSFPNKSMNNTIKNKQGKLNNAVLKYFKIGKSAYITNKKNIKTENLKPELHSIGLKLNKQNIRNNIYFKTYNTTSNSHSVKNDFVYLQNSQNYNLLNKIQNNRKEKEKEEKSQKIFNKNINYRNLHISKNVFVNSNSTRNNMNKYLFLKNKERINGIPNFIINNTYINNYNNRNIININGNKLNNNKINNKIFESIKNKRFDAIKRINKIGLKYNTSNFN